MKKKNVFGAIFCALIWAVMITIIAMGYFEYESKTLETAICIVCIVGYYFGFRYMFMKDPEE